MNRGFNAADRHPDYVRYARDQHLPAITPVAFYQVSTAPIPPLSSRNREKTHAEGVLLLLPR